MPNYPLGPDGQPISNVEPFLLSEVSTALVCPCCGCYIKDVELSDGFEAMVAHVLKAKDATYWTGGYDVYDSDPFPGHAFQAKYAQARCAAPKTKEVNGRICTFKERWTWTWIRGD